MKADASDSGKPRTWTLHGYSHIHLSGSALGRGEVVEGGEVVEVMPVADHEKAMAEMREETEFLRRAVYRAEQAWATAEDELARLREAATDVIRAVERWLAETAPGMHVNTAKGRTATRAAVAALARAANRALGQ